MADFKNDGENELPEGVKIYAPDKSIHKKMGNVNLDQVLSPQVVKAAQSKIEEAAEQFAEESLEQARELDEACRMLIQTPANFSSLTPQLVNAAFSLKSKTAIGGYDLVSALAKSLQLYAEAIQGKAPSPKNLEIIQWHMGSIKALLAAKVKGDGGQTGAAIRAEIERLSQG